MKTIKKMIIVIMLVIGIPISVIPVKAMEANLVGLTVPLRFLYDVDTNGLEQGNAIPLVIAQDVYCNGQKVFQQGGSGFALIDEFKKAGSFGRSGSLKISQGQIMDIKGNSYLIYLSANAKGGYKFSSPAGALIGTSTAYNIAEAALDTGSVTGLLFGAGAALIPVAYLLKKGGEAKLSKAKIMFAQVIRPLNQRF